jgi:hypothetical protein
MEKIGVPGDALRSSSSDHSLEASRQSECRQTERRQNERRHD